MIRTLYSYCMPYDNGSAPNPFGGICTLTICKPVIRRTAQVGDWVVATGSAEYGFENMLVYAMEVTQKMTMQEYDGYCISHLKEKIPNISTNSNKQRVGDSIYDFSKKPSEIRKGSVHNEGNRERDLGGEYALLSENFYYFGGKPVLLPGHLLNIVRQGQGHKSTSNNPYFNAFIDWMNKFNSVRNIVFAEPFLKKQVDLGEEYFDSNCASCPKKNP